MSISGKISLWDIDGTLADDSHRRHHFDARDYASYFSPALMLSDPVLAEGENQFRTLSESGWSLAFATARRERNREVTEQWLIGAGLKGPWPVFMRADDSEETPAEFKSSVIRAFQESGYEVVFYEDDQKVYEELVAKFGEDVVTLVHWAPR